MKVFLVIVSLFCCTTLFSQQITSFNDSWQFIKGTDTTNQEWEPIQVPHTWNSEDPFDKMSGYYRGLSWYKKRFQRPNSQKSYLRFEAVNQEANIYVNGKIAGSHLGGYTAFNIDITDFLIDGNNEILVSVDNSHNENAPPLKGDFNFYGGIYRDIWLHEINSIHFQRSEFGDLGIFIRSPQVSEKAAIIEVQSNIITQIDGSSVTIEHSLYDDDGILVNTVAKQVTIKLGFNSFTMKLPKVNDPLLWHPESPNLYRLESRIITLNDSILDIQSNPVGLRWFEFDPNKGFFINGASLKLMGTNRHQDYLGLGNAITDERHRADVELIKDMGSNFFRTAHYPQDKAVLNAADQLGLLVSMEIPLDHDITDSPAFLENSKHMQKEMIRQYYNHPSIIIWAYMNEMMLGRNYERDQEIIEKIRLQALALEELTRQEDPTRYTMIPNHGALDLYIKAGLTEIPMIVGWNLYYGWYEEDEKGAGKFLDSFHEKVPDKPVLITEYGAGADPRIRSLVPERFDFSIEWQNEFHQNNLIQIFEREFLSGAAIWNLADFGSEGRNDADPKINSKGVLSYDRQPKDSYYLYQAWLRRDPIIWIGSRNWNKRIISKGEKHPIEVYTNSEHVELILNHQSLGKKKVLNNIAKWDIMFNEGENLLEAVIEGDAKIFKDAAKINVSILDMNNIDWYPGLNINFGATFNFTDQTNEIIWIPDLMLLEENQLVKGQTFRPRERGIGSDRTIMNTVIDPIYQTHVSGSSKYRFKTNPGNYEITFHWAEVRQAANRVFDVLVNGQNAFSNLNIEKEAGFSTAYSKKIIVSCENSLVIEFQKISGDDPMISGLQIKRLN